MKKYNQKKMKNRNSEIYFSYKNKILIKIRDFSYVFLKIKDLYYIVFIVFHKTRKVFDSFDNKNYAIFIPKLNSMYKLFNT